MILRLFLPLQLLFDLQATPHLSAQTPKDQVLAKQKSRSQPLQPHNSVCSIRQPQQRENKRDTALQPENLTSTHANALKPGGRMTTARYIPPGKRNKGQAQPVAFAVQLYPDMSSLTLVQPDHQQVTPTVFSGHPSPDHHNKTAFSHYIAHVCPDNAEDFGVDVWLDTFHTTLGDVELSMSQVSDFQDALKTAVDSLPPVTSLQYTTTELQHTVKENRLKKNIKGEHFYYLGLTAAPDQLKQVLQPWMSAMQCAADAVRGKFTPKSFNSHHMTIRCHTKAPVERTALQNAQNAVRCKPITFRAAGIRVQLAASQALEHCGPDQVKTYTKSDGSEVRYPVPIYTSGEAASVLLESTGNTHEATGTSAAMEAMASMIL